MLNFIFIYSDAGCSNYDTVVFKAKSLNDAILYAKKWCKASSKNLLGVVNSRAFSDSLHIF